jgi:hypothetical protein
MKRLTILGALTFGLAAFAMADDFKGFIEDANCAKKPAMKDNAECAQKCIKGGSKAVLVTPDGDILQIADQDKVVAHAGHKVVITGTKNGDTLTVTKVTMQ